MDGIDGTVVGSVPADRSTRSPRWQIRRRPVLNLLVWRIPLGLLSVVFVACLTYLATSVLPGSAASAILGPEASKARVAELSRQLGLNRPLLSGLVHFLGHAVTGNFGISLTEHIPVSQVIGARIANSAVLLIVVAVTSTLLGVVSGCIAARFRDSWFDDLLSTLALIVAALPEFVVGVLVIFVFSLGIFHWFPAVSVFAPTARIWNYPDKLVLPALTLVLVCTPYMYRMVRASMIDALQSDYAEVALLKGVSARRLLFLHALPNAVAPAIQVAGLNLLYLAGGVVLVETVFQYPGIGLALVTAIQARDVPVIQMIVVLLATFYVVVNIVTDILVLLSTPRRRLPR